MFVRKLSGENYRELLVGKINNKKRTNFRDWQKYETRIQATLGGELQVCLLYSSRNHAGPILNKI